MKTALLISTYNWKEALSLIFKSIEEQTQLPDEILIADDGSREDTKIIIDKFRQIVPTPIIHVWHEDIGFRRSMILNKTIAQANADYIIQIDGDCIMHKDFIKDHISNASPNTYLYGSRVNIKSQYIEKVIKTEHIKFNFASKEIKNKTRALHISALSKLYKPHTEVSSKIRGCNLSFWKNDFITINGYSEDFEGWGMEDSEMIQRMHNNGILAKRLRYSGIVFHMYHKSASKDNASHNNTLLLMTRKSKVVTCEKGINQYL
ncbi:hypothetical protein CLV62_14718 [Dysgonomonas alginatilytica]|uniref:Galactosyltransferase-like protein n=1 Tax=Dysgonomonas alginatilytica TaxID=1605892 RepID=A0A2V3PKE5_9BACT|nr:glycosyltransferase family 2 protein [Dysgonomonas alginatilytica]PXV58449.1 hypothetical protein CLV62_14718 [Dysgonomonas alginatilytica]